VLASDPWVWGLHGVLVFLLPEFGVARADGGSLRVRVFYLGTDVDPGGTRLLGQHLEGCLSRIVLAMGFNEF
jgi:hypothetical protein